MSITRLASPARRRAETVRSNAACGSPSPERGIGEDGADCTSGDGEPHAARAGAPVAAEAQRRAAPHADPQPPDALRAEATHVVLTTGDR
jgi:hypothetical protein